MPTVLHPCAVCGHETMDECWAAAKELPKKHRGLCLDCHDECVPKVTDHLPRPAGRPRRAPEGPDPRLFFARATGSR